MPCNFPLHSEQNTQIRLIASTEKYSIVASHIHSPKSWRTQEIENLSLNKAHDNRTTDLVYSCSNCILNRFGSSLFIPIAIVCISYTMCVHSCYHFHSTQQGWMRRAFSILFVCAVPLWRFRFLLRCRFRIHGGIHNESLLLQGRGANSKKIRNKTWSELVMRMMRMRRDIPQRENQSIKRTASSQNLHSFGFRHNGHWSVSGSW